MFFFSGVSVVEPLTMRALRRVSIKARFPSLSLSSTTAIKKSISTPSQSQCTNHEPPSIIEHDDDDNNAALKPCTQFNKSNVMLAASAAAASLTPAGYAISPLGVTVLSNLPLAAFAFVQISGLSPIRQILKDKATGDLSPFPFVSLYTNCAVWSLYGILQQDQTILIANVAGTVVGAVYTVLFAKYTHQSMMKFYVGSGAILGIFLSTPAWSQQLLGVDAATILGTNIDHDMS